MFSQPGNKHVKAAAQEIIVFPPEVFQYFFSFEDLVFMYKQVLEQLYLPLGKGYSFVVGDAYLKLLFV